TVRPGGAGRNPARRSSPSRFPPTAHLYAGGTGVIMDSGERREEKEKRRPHEKPPWASPRERKETRRRVGAGPLPRPAGGAAAPSATPATPLQIGHADGRVVHRQFYGGGEDVRVTI